MPMNKPYALANSTKQHSLGFAEVGDLAVAKMDHNGYQKFIKFKELDDVMKTCDNDRPFLQLNTDYNPLRREECNNFHEFRNLESNPSATTHFAGMKRR